MPKFELQAKTIIQSASLDLSAQQLLHLSQALPYVVEAREMFMRRLEDTTGPDPGAEALTPVQDLLQAIDSLVQQAGTIKPKRTMRRRKSAANPT